MTMNTTSILVGAGLMFAVGGAMAGASLGSTPILEQADPGAAAPEVAFSGSETLPYSRLPAATADHYPLVTPQGTVPVAALSDRGLYRQARYADMRYDAAVYDGARDQPPFVEASDPAQSAGETASQMPRGPGPAVARATPKTPLELEQGPATLGDTVQAGETPTARPVRAKVIHVEAALAAM